MTGQRGPRYSTVAIVLHWTIAAAIVLQIVLSWRMDGRTPEAFAVTQLHKSIGITILLLSLVRIAWRLTHRPPPEPPGLTRWELALSKLTHLCFYAIMIAMPLTGWLTVSASRIAIPTLLYGAVPWPNLPGLAGLAPGALKTWHDIGETGHGLIADLIYVLLALHVAGALKHQLFRPDEPVLARMAPGAVPGRKLEPRLLLIALAAVAVIAFGRWFQPALPATAPPPPPPVEAPVVAMIPLTEPGPPTSKPLRWKVQPGSQLTFATAWSGSAIEGRFDKWTADILFSSDALAASKVTVAIDMASATSGDAQRDAALPAPDWFDAAAHPKASFTATKFSKSGADRYIAHGTLSLRGVTKPLDLQFRLTITGSDARMTGSAAIDRTVFGVGQGEFAGTQDIPARVTVRVQLTARAAAP